LWGDYAFLSPHVLLIFRVFKRKKIKSLNHQKFIASNNCIICGHNQVQCCHIRSIPNYGNIGMGVRNDMFCLPMCFSHHAEQHKIGEYTFYKKYNKNPILIAEYFALNSLCKKVKDLAEGYYNDHRVYFTESY